MIKLTHLLKEEESFTATSKKTGQTSVFKSKDARDSAVNGIKVVGTHVDLTLLYHCLNKILTFLSLFFWPRANLIPGVKSVDFLLTDFVPYERNR